MTFRIRAGSAVRILAVTLLGLAASTTASAEAARTITVDGVERRYLIHPPPQASTQRIAAVLVLHGGGGNPKQIAESTQLSATADRHGFVAIYPAGTGPLSTTLTWNAGGCCGSAMKNQVDDVGFIRALIAHIVAEHNVDPKRIYVTGISNGAMMAYRLACELPERIAAIAPVAGQSMMPPCRPQPAVSILHIHGNDDRCALYHGGSECGGCFQRVLGIGREVTWPCDPVPASVARFADAYACAPRQPYERDGPMICEIAAGCRDNAEVALCTIAGGGHTWPGAQPPAPCRNNPRGRLCRAFERELGTTVAIEGNELIWRFFVRHRR